MTSFLPWLKFYKIKHKTILKQAKYFISPERVLYFKQKKKPANTFLLKFILCVNLKNDLCPILFLWQKIEIKKIFHRIHIKAEINREIKLGIPGTVKYEWKEIFNQTNIQILNN